MEIRIAQYGVCVHYSEGRDLVGVLGRLCTRERGCMTEVCVGGFALYIRRKDWLGLARRHIN